ncbi:hypothetical protein ATW7_18390 [Alteromonadales bacterium TW-7]|jgi:hypothetical protein|nr:hypothetical protein ATW7_18390 [Alteromonadales bacterium TW-7]
MLEFLTFLITLLVLLLVSQRLKEVDAISLEALFYVFYSVYAVLGALSLILRLDERRLNDVIINYDILYFIWMISTIGFLCLVLLVSIIKRRFNRHRRTLSFTNESYSDSAIVFLSLFIVFVSFVHFNLSDAPLSILLKGGDVQDAFIARQSQITSYGFFKLSHFNFLTREVQFFWCCFLFSFFLKTKRLKWILFLCTFSMLVSFYSNLSKAGGLFLLAAYGLIYLNHIRKSLNLIVVLSGILVIVILAVIPQYLFIPSDQEFDFLKYFKAVFSRIVSGQIEPAYYVINFIDSTDFLYGSTFPNPKAIFPFEHFDLETKTWEIMNPTRLSMGLSYKNPTVFWVDGYANFGIFGVIVYYLIVVAILVLIDSFFLRKSEVTSIDIGFIMYISFHYSRLSGKSLSTFFWDVDIAVVIIFYLISRKMIIKNRV